MKKPKSTHKPDTHFTLIEGGIILEAQVLSIVPMLIPRWTPKWVASGSS